MITQQERNITLVFYFGALSIILESIFVFMQSESPPQGHSTIPRGVGSLLHRGGIFSCVCVCVCACVCSLDC